MSRGEGHRASGRHGHHEDSTHLQHTGSQERKQANVSQREDILTDFEMVNAETADFNIPSATPHPHFPCVAIMDSRVQNVMELVAIGIQDAADEVLWTSHPDRKNHDPCKVSATVFLGSQRISLSVHLFTVEAKAYDKKDNQVVLQAFCVSVSFHSSEDTERSSVTSALFLINVQGYGWDFYTIWDYILLELRSNAKKVQRFVPEPIEEPNRHSSQPSLVEQLRTFQVPARYSTSANPSLPQVSVEDIPSLLPSAPHPLTADTVLSLLQSPYDNERCTGIDLVESSLGCKEMREAVQTALFECVAADNSYAQSRIRALSLVDKMIKEKHISSESTVMACIRRGMENFEGQWEYDDDNKTPAFRHMMQEYAALASKVIENADYNIADEKLVNSLEKAKEQLIYC